MPVSQSLNWVSLLSIFIALLALVVSLAKHRADEFRTRDAQAKKAWSDFLTLAFENPDLTTTSIACVNSKRYEQYEYFVYMLLMRADDILQCFPRSNYWSGQIKHQLQYHGQYLADWSDDDIDHFTPQLAKMIREVSSNA